MKKEYYEKHFNKGELVVCMPINMNKIGFIHKDTISDEDDYESYELPTRLIAFLPKKIELGSFGTVTWASGIDKLFLTANHLDWIVETSAFMMNEASKKTGWYSIPNNEKAHLAKGITYIDGEVYAYGMVRSVFRYKGIKEWENITTKIKHPNLYEDVEKSKDTFVGDWVGFSALDGFNANDIYAGGNRGDFWHYNGKIWKKIDLPSNADISTILCVKDNYVYVGCRLGPVMVGKENSWTVIEKSQQVTHSCWFNGEIYFSCKDGRIYTHKEGKKGLEEAKFKTNFPKYMLHNIVGIASCDECLVAYTTVQAYAYDGEVWHEIIEIPSLSKHK